MRRIILSDMALKIISIIVAIVLWMYVMSEQNPHITTVIKEVPVKLLNMDEDKFALKDNDDKLYVNVKVKGRRSIIMELKPDDIKADIKMKGRTEGENLLPVNVEVPNNVELLDFYPKEIMLSLDAIIEEQFPVTVDIQGVPAQGFAAGEPRAKPQAVVVKGPRSKIDSIKQVVAKVDIKDMNADINATIPLRVIDGQGQVQKDVTFWPETVDIYLPIVPVKEVSVIPNIKGDPPEGYFIRSVKTENPTVQVTGSEETLAQLDVITTETIDIGGQINSIVREVNLLVPENVKLIEPHEGSTKVQIEIEKHADLEMVLNSEDIVVENLSQDLVAEIEKKELTLTISGPESTIEKVTNNMIKVYIDASELDVGEHQTKILGTINRPYNIIKIQPDNIKIVIRKL